MAASERLSHRNLALPVGHPRKCSEMVLGHRPATAGNETLAAATGVAAPSVPVYVAAQTASKASWKATSTQTSLDGGTSESSRRQLRSSPTNAYGAPIAHVHVPVALLNGAALYMSHRSRFSPDLCRGPGGHCPALTHWTGGLESHVSRLFTCLIEPLPTIVDPGPVLVSKSTIQVVLDAAHHW